MRTKFSSVTALICILIYTGALGIGGFRIYTSINERRILANREFFDLADIASSTDASGFMGEPFQKSIQDAVINSKTLGAVILSGPQDANYTFEREAGIITWVNGSPRFVSRFGLSRNPLFAPLYIEGLRNITIQAVFDYLEYPALITTLRYALFAVLAALILAFFALIMELILSNNQAGEGEPARPPLAPEKPPAQEAAKTGEPFRPDTPEPDAGTGGAESGIVAEPGINEMELEIDDMDDIDDIDMGGMDDIDAFNLPEPDMSMETEELPESPGAEPVPEREDSPPDSPQGLYSPHGNIGWEAYTEDRLEAELHRCASFDQDLVLILMEFKDTGNLDDRFYNQFTDAAVRFFTLRDLIFERGQRGVSIILPNTDLEQGLAKSEEFHNHILSTMSASLITNTDLCIGISSRSGRLIGADRITREASQALEKALSDPVSPIVAFKSDPEKYRAFIASQNKSPL
jgi:hypothetical protein